MLALFGRHEQASFARPRSCDPCSVRRRLLRCSCRERGVCSGSPDLASAFSSCLRSGLSGHRSVAVSSFAINGCPLAPLFRLSDRGAPSLPEVAGDTRVTRVGGQWRTLPRHSPHSTLRLRARPQRGQDGGSYSPLAVFRRRFLAVAGPLENCRIGNGEDIPPRGR